MFGEIGYFCLLLALVATAMQIVVLAIGLYHPQSSVNRLAIPFSYSIFLALLGSFLALMLAFLTRDYSLIYVADHSNSLMTWYYRLSAVWGGHEGSLLLWVLVLATWISLVCRFSAVLPPAMLVRVLFILAICQLPILVFLVTLSSPFLSILPNVPVDGADLNPLLQDPGLIFHPPILYSGYVGMAIPFAFGVAGLWAGRMDSLWMAWMRPWVLAAWCFLTLGIALGSWWAYYELGWGGWWFWDPVENASLMPWLVATALLHTLSAARNRGVMKIWVSLLCIMGFAFSLLGTFMVRSGVLVSVHAFAADPERGIYLLATLVLIVALSLVVFIKNAHRLLPEGYFHLFSKENMLGMNNLLLMTTLTVVFVGTLYPVFADALDWQQLSVGAPYFNLLVAPLAWTGLLLMAFAPIMVWQKTKTIPISYAIFAVISVVVAVVLTYVLAASAWRVSVTLALSVWVLLAQLWSLRDKLQLRQLAVYQFFRLPKAYLAMQLAHLGFLVFAIGASVTSHYSMQKDVVLSVGERASLGAYSFELKALEQVQGSNYQAIQAHMQFGKPPYIASVYPQKRTYVVGQSVMTEAGIDSSLWRDIYVSMAEPVDSAASFGAWAFRVQVKPLVRWLWLGAIMMALGGLLALLDRRQSA